MNHRSEKEIERINELFREIGAGDFIPLPVRDAKLFCENDNTRGEFEYSESCQKVIYPSAAIAEKVALHRRKKGAGRLRVYKCEECQGFHLSSFIRKFT